MADLEVSPEVWRTHAAHIASVGDGLDTVESASDAALAGEPFGKLCTPLFASSYESAKTQFDSSLSDIGDLFEQDVADLRGAATDFEETDSQAATGANNAYPSY